MLMFDRLDRLDQLVDERDTEAFLRGRVPVFDVTNLAGYLNDNQATDVFTHPYGPPFRTYWIEYATNERSDLGISKVGMLCQTVDVEGAPADVKTVDITLWLQVHKKPVGPLLAWQVRFSSERPPTYKLVRQPDFEALKSLRQPAEPNPAVDDPPHPVTPDPGEREQAQYLTTSTDGTQAVLGNHASPETRGTAANRSRVDADRARRVRQLHAAVERQRAEIDKVEAKGNALVESGLFEKAIRTVLFMHALLACNNVETETRSPPATLSKKHSRKTGRALVSHKVIKVAPTGARSEAQSGEHSDGSSDPLHIVRGHFKTFTSERPLFGRHVGTYWWTPTVKGNASNGVNVADYTIPAP